jgi:nicotinamidase-related amidase
VKQKIDVIVGQPVLLVIDIAQSIFIDNHVNNIPLMPDIKERMMRSRRIVDAARVNNVPVIFFEEAHRKSMVDFGRELDGAEGVHCVEGDLGTPVAAEFLGVTSDDYVIRKRRYSCFFGTDLEILLKGLKAKTLILIGCLTDVCVHYTFADGHQNDYYCRVIPECVGGSSLAAHQASLNAMTYLQSEAQCSSEEIVAAFGQLLVKEAA